VKISEKVVYAEIITEEGRIYGINGIIEGHIIEFNESLVSNPGLLTSDVIGN
jgi:hypothetical protein